MTYELNLSVTQEPDNTQQTVSNKPQLHLISTIKQSNNQIITNNPPRLFPRTGNGGGDEQINLM